MKKGPKKTVSVSLPVELYERLRERAEATCRTVPGYIRQVLVGREPPVDRPLEGMCSKTEP